VSGERLDGNGGLRRGWAFLPSRIYRGSAVSSPQNIGAGRRDGLEVESEASLLFLPISFDSRASSTAAEDARDSRNELASANRLADMRVVQAKTGDQAALDEERRCG